MGYSGTEQKIPISTLFPKNTFREEFALSGILLGSPAKMEVTKEISN
jgi:hypothetical protein